jgi:cellulose synthase (UDP-forming)
VKPAHPQSSRVSRWLLITVLVASAIYFAGITWYFQRGNQTLYIIFLIGEIFHLWQVLGYVATVWGFDRRHQFQPDYHPRIDIFITVAGEPTEIVRQTAIAAQAISYEPKTIYLLNDGLVASKDNWQDIEALASELDITCLTRQQPGGAKAGNINHALRQTHGELIAIFDADHVPMPIFLEATAGYFADEHVGFVQSPQYYANHSLNYVTGGAWEQQELFFGPILRGKNRSNAAFMCGTNTVIRRTAIEGVGGMCETNISEDFLTSLFMHQQGWKSVYVPTVWANGLAPEDFSSYYKQQYRWARGSLEVIFKYNPLFRRGLSFMQRIQYLTSASYYLSGFVVLADALLPIVFFFTGQVVFKISTMSLAAIFIPYIFLTLLALQISSNFSFTFRALAFSYGSFWLQMKAVTAVLTNQKTTFAVTPKQQLHGNFLPLVIPNLVYIGLFATGASYAVWRDGISASVVTNIAWATLNTALFFPMVLAASPFGARNASHPATHEAPVT